MPKVITSKYPGWCGLCRQEYAVGDPICWLPKPVTGPQGGVYKFAHPECLAEERDSEPPAQADKPPAKFGFQTSDAAILIAIQALQEEVAAIRAILEPATDNGSETTDRETEHAR